MVDFTTFVRRISRRKFLEHWFHWESQDFWLPQVDMIAFLPHYLEGLFGILASDNRDFRLKAFILAARAP